MREINASGTLWAQKAPLIAAVTRLTAPGDVVLIDPDIKPEWLDFERRAGLPTWKFAPPTMLN